MAERTLTAALVITAYNKAGRALREVGQQLKQLRKDSAELREVAGHLGMIGAAGLGAGAAIAYSMKEAVGPAMQVEDQLHRLRNTLPAGAAGMRELAQAQRATAQTSEQLGIAQEGLLKQVYLGTSAGLGMAASIKSMAVASKLAIGLGGDLEDTQRTLNLAFINFKDPSLSATQNIRALGDAMATAAAKFDYKNIEELREQLELATPTALSAGMGNVSGFKDMIALLADFTRHGLTGSMAGEALEESLHGVLLMQQKLGIPLVMNAKGGIDLMRSLAGVRQHYIDLYGSMKAIPYPILQQLQSVFGQRGLRALLIDQREVMAMRAQLNQTGGAVNRFAAEMLKSPTQQFAIFSQNMRQVFVQLGYSMLPVLVSISKTLVPIARAAADFAKAHPGWVKMATVGAVIAATVLTIGGALALAGSALAGFGAMIPVMAALASGVGVAATAFASLDAAMLMNPIGLVVAGIAAAGIAAYELYEHWATVKHALVAACDAVKNFGASMYEAGAHLMSELGHGIEAAAMWPVQAVEGVAHRIRAYLPFSPAKVGPLRDLHHVRIVQTIAETMKPAPMVSAMRKVAAAAALTLPLTIAPVAQALAAPALSMRGPHATSTAPTIQNVINVTVEHRGNGDENDLEDRVQRAVSRALDESSYKLAQTLRRHNEMQKRLEFE